MDLLQEVASLLTGTLKRLSSHIRVHVLSLQVQVGKKDAAETALVYGKACSVVYPAVGTIAGLTRCRKYAVEVFPDFNEGQTEIKGECRASIPLLFLLTTGISFAIRGILLLKRQQILSLLKSSSVSQKASSREK